MKNQDDRIHIEQVKQGNLASYTYLVDKYKNMAFTVAKKILPNTQDAEDAAQESFVKAYMQIGSFEGKSKFSTWLYTIVYRTAVSKLQARQLALQHIDEELEQNYDYQYSPPPLEALQTREREQFVKDAINRLPKLEALIVTLYYLNDSPIEEIEQITGLSNSNVKVKLFRARKMLGKELHFLL
ncbi:RNA polymerase sigma factor [Dyadobacter fermentans]|uniref:RNA polymerase, sigma-24 subunit, ECF subfamily n=1 Tax=Dyadobacter fermentans (strain ATCC 700827 / DSM 18053 / CIP 107007 / KCTC 52180 / NS114) TaxID=471854 RepID=C6W5W6_DYAFD|nr:sigma-70 family RNA polymerase sigma factor [Dyadobacter fermentans]ACT96055.1 RNA polymerase, sigma-24 subunit, ECF subfamily [Dyadobacter fermentans DSM 18053]